MTQIPLFPDATSRGVEDAGSPAIDSHGRRIGQPRTWFRDRGSWQAFVRLLHAKRNGRRDQDAKQETNE